MRVIGVLDLKNGVVVRGIAGRREEYRPIVSRLCSTTEPEDVARAFVEMGLKELYLADLDAILGAEPARAVYDAIRATGATLAVDAGVRCVEDGLRLAETGVETIVAGLETASPEVVAELAAELGVRLMFSLDLREGTALGDGGDPFLLAANASASGVRRVLVLDLARVGVGSGIGTEDLCARLARTYPHVEIIAGGGVRGREDLVRLSKLGVRAVLVASALHDGRLTRDDLLDL